MLQALQVRLGQWPRFTGMEHGAPQARALFIVTGLVREVSGCESSLNFFQAVFTLVVTISAQRAPAESRSPR